MGAGRAPEVVIAGLAAETSSIRVGSGSVLLNHYGALKVAEVFCTLIELYPGRIDFGAGRVAACLRGVHQPAGDAGDPAKLPW